MFSMLGMSGKEGIGGSFRGHGAGGVHPTFAVLQGSGPILGQDGSARGHVGKLMFTLGIEILGSFGSLGIVKLPKSGLLNPGSKARHIACM